MKEHKIDSHKLILHPGRVAMWNAGEQIAPIYVEISLTNMCNQMCVFCAFDYTKQKPRYLKYDILIERLREMYDLGVRALCFAGEGEPLLYGELEKLIKECHEIGFDLAISTNGLLFDNEKIKNILPYLTWIRFSINGWETNYSNIHGCFDESKSKYYKVLDNIFNCVEYKLKNNLKTTIGVQTIFMQENQSDILNIIYDVSKIGADYISLKPIITHLSSINQRGQELSDIEVEQIYNSAINFNNDKFSVIMRKHPYEHINQKKTYDKCLGLPFFCEIGSDGGIYTCGPFLLNEKFCYGNIYEQTFYEIWAGEKRKEILNQISEMDIHKECMKACRLDRINEYLWELKNLPNSVNFI